MKLVFWWNIPCKGIMEVFEELSKINEDDTIIITGAMSQSRLSMGWLENDNQFYNHIILNKDEYGKRDVELLKKYKDYLHVFGGIVYPFYVTNLMDEAVKLKINFFNMSEAYCNMDYSWKRNFKNMYYKYILPFKHKKVAENSLGVFSLSGGAKDTMQKFYNCTWSKSKVFPFGYYTGEDFENNKLNTNSNQIINILCPGLLEIYKGVDLLIKAAAILVNNNITNFKIHITGKGSQKEKLEQLSKDLGIISYVSFYGALNHEDYTCLYKSIDILIAPGRSEPWGIRINEAIQKGLVVIVSDGIGASELIKESKGGAVFQSCNIQELSNVLKNYLMDLSLLEESKKRNIVYKKEISPQKKAIDLLALINENSIEKIIINDY